MFWVCAQVGSFEDVLKRMEVQFLLSLPPNYKDPNWVSASLEGPWPRIIRCHSALWIVPLLYAICDVYFKNQSVLMRSAVSNIFSRKWSITKKSHMHAKYCKLRLNLLLFWWCRRLQKLEQNNFFLASLSVKWWCVLGSLRVFAEQWGGNRLGRYSVHSPRNWCFETSRQSKRHSCRIGSSLCVPSGLNIFCLSIQ